MRRIENKQQNDRYKCKGTNKNIKCEWIDPSNQNLEIIKMDKKQDATICCIQETHFRFKDTIFLEFF